MATIEHSVLSDSEVHEPKGISAASEGQVYQADGSGSGDWADLPTGYSRWSWNIDSSTTTATALTSGVATVLTNDAAGAAYLDFGITGTSDPWDTTDNSFDFSEAGLEVGDDFEIRLDLTFTVNSANDGFQIYMSYADGEDEEVQVLMAHENVDTAGSQEFIFTFSGFVGNSDFLTNPARMYITADSTNDEVLVNGFKFTALPREVRYI